MKNIKKNRKVIALALGLAAMTLSASELNAQGRPGGLFGETQPSENTHGTLGRGSDYSVSDGGGIENSGIGENAPLGSGIAILIGAGLGYVALKKKEDKQ